MPNPLKLLKLIEPKELVEMAAEAASKFPSRQVAEQSEDPAAFVRQNVLDQAFVSRNVTDPGLTVATMLGGKSRDEQINILNSLDNLGIVGDPTLVKKFQREFRRLLLE